MLVTGSVFEIEDLKSFLAGFLKIVCDPDVAAEVPHVDGVDLGAALRALPAEGIDKAAVGLRGIVKHLQVDWSEVAHPLAGVTVAAELATREVGEADVPPHRWIASTDAAGRYTLDLGDGMDGEAAYLMVYRQRSSFSFPLYRSATFKVESSREDPVEHDDPRLLAWTQCLVASVWVGVTERALDLAVAELPRSGDHSMLPNAVTEMALELEAASVLVEQVADDWSAGVDHGDRWLTKLAAARHRAGEAAKRVVDLALEVTGEAGPGRQELERLYREVHLGGLPAVDTPHFRGLVRKSVLGVHGQD